MNLMNKSQPRHQYKYLIFLSVFYFVGWALSYPVAYKVIYLHNILESAAIVFFPICYAIADIITEVYGYKLARQVVWTGIICGFIFCVALQLVAYIPAAGYWHHNKNYEFVFGRMIRVFFSFTIGSFIANFTNIFIISKFKIMFKGRYFWIRSLLSTGIGELIFSFVGGAMVYIGVEPWSKMIFLMLDGYLFKMLYAMIAVWPTVLLVKLLKRAENSDVYDIGINYNPFKFNTN